MKIGGLIIGPGISSIVRDGRTLNAMAKAGHFVRVHRHQPYVDEQQRPRVFHWKGNKYRIEYFDGCFYPFVVKQPPQ